MPFTLVWLEESTDTFHELEAAAQNSLENRQKSKKAKASNQEGLFKQVVKCVELLQANPRHPGLKTHEYNSIENPYDPDTKVFEAYGSEPHTRRLPRLLVLRSKEGRDHDHRHHAASVSGSVNLSCSSRWR